MALRKQSAPLERMSLLANGIVVGHAPFMNSARDANVNTEVHPNQRHTNRNQLQTIFHNCES